MTTLSRRRFLEQLGLGAALAPGALRGLRSADPAPRATAAGGRIEELAALVRTKPVEELLPALVSAARRGATLEELFGGVFLAGCQDIHPRPVGFKLHCVMMVESAFQLALAAPDDERLLPVLFNAHNFKAAQIEDEEQGGWELGPRPAVALGDRASARVELERAFAEHDLERADRAVVGALAELELGDVLALLVEHGAREFRDIGHRIIFTCNVFRVLERLGGRAAEPALRCLVHGLLCGEPDDTLALFAANRARAATLGEPRAGAADPRTSGSLLTRLRDATSEQAVALVLDALAAGETAASVWDGLRLLASEYQLRAPGLLAVHPVTVVNALRAACRWRGPSGAAERLFLLQAAAWLPLYRDRLGRGGPLSMAGPGIDALAASEEGQPDLERVFAEADRDPARAARLVLALDDRAGFVSGARRLVLRKATGSHHYKYAAAAFEDAALTHPAWAGHLLATSVHYLPMAGTPDSPAYEAARRALG